MTPDNINENELNIGDMFLIRINNIKALKLNMNIKSNGITKFKSGFDSISLKPTDFDTITDHNQCLTIIKYIGNNQFLEYYTNKIILCQEIDSFEYTDPYNFIMNYNQFLKFPLWIKKIDLLPINLISRTDYAVQFENQSIENVGDIIESFEMKSIKNLTNSFERLKQKDEILAYAENCVYELANREVPKL